ncbi:amino acid permease [Sciscionella sediminilitoris]|uniref:amino acid permease n=1 Tax=Sciscionella sediminilitoris TaxID=1445613 RepID=UPI0009E7DDC2|nr:amino acid permease [Sciscionella sp. SE31]
MVGVNKDVEHTVGREGYGTGLSRRHVQMIAIGGSIGVGLFLGSGGRMHSIGPALVLAYALCGLAGFFVMRALGELALYRPSSGSFVTYSREFIGPWAGFASGWMYWMNWATTGVAEITAVGTYVQKWAPGMPQWITALLALGVLLLINLISVKVFGELEFWFSVLKVVAICAFLAVGIFIAIDGSNMGGGVTAGPHNLVAGGGFFPNGFGVVLISLQAVIFAYSAIEMVGITAGETANPQKVLPKAVNAVAWRIAVFYIGSILLLGMALPHTMYNGDASPFVMVFSKVGIPAAGDLMNVVVITAALSSCNSGLYSTGRILRSLAQRGEAPRFAGRMSSRQVPVGGIALTAIVYLAGIVLNFFVPKEAFDLATSVAGVGVIATWAAFLYSNARFNARTRRGELERPSFRMPGAPWTNYGTLIFLALVVVLMGFTDETAQRIAFFIAVPGAAVVLIIGWLCVRKRSHAAARAEESEQAQLS